MRELAVAWLIEQGYDAAGCESWSDEYIFKVVLLESFYQGEQYERGEDEY